MIFQVDFDSDESLYMQLFHQIIQQIAMEQLSEGDTLPSVRQMADDVGINMHTVNKTYALLREKGFIRLDQRHGAVVCVNLDHMLLQEEIERELRYTIAKAICRNISTDEIHEMVDGIIREFKEESQDVM